MRHVDAGRDAVVPRRAETDPTGLATRIENRVTSLGRRSNQLTESIADARREAERARAQRDRPFTHTDQLATVRRAAADLHRQMNELATQQPAPPAAEAPTSAGGTASPNGRTAARQVPPSTASPRSALQR